MLLRHDIKRLGAGPMVRPWALLAPTLVLLVCLPLLRPLRQPVAGLTSEGEKARLATVQAIVEHRTLAIDAADPLLRNTSNRIRVGGSHYSDQPPMLAALLAPSYWVMYKAGWTMEDNPILVAYLLTLLGVTLPVAAGGGLVYRMGRLFELPRRWRAGLAAVVVLGSGLITYATVLNAHAPAAALVLMSAACLIHVGMSKHMARSLPFLALGGFLAALAATIDLPAATFLFLLVFVIIAFRAPLALRVGGVALYGLGALGPILLHAAMTVPLTGGLLPPNVHRELATDSTPAIIAALDSPDRGNPWTEWLGHDEGWDAPAAPGWGSAVWASIERVVAALIGPHGLLSHFPILIVALFGIGKVMHRHWPVSTKMLAVATLGSAVVILLTCALWSADWSRAMFAARWFIVFTPLLLFWSGAWLRRSHHPAKWAMVSVLLAFSVVVSLIGATNPAPRRGYDGYTATAALKDLVQSKPTPIRQASLAGR